MDHLSDTICRLWLVRRVQNFGSSGRRLDLQQARRRRRQQSIQRRRRQHPCSGSVAANEAAAARCASVTVHSTQYTVSEDSLAADPSGPPLPPPPPPHTPAVRVFCRIPTSHVCLVSLPSPPSVSFSAWARARSRGRCQGAIGLSPCFVSTSEQARVSQLGKYTIVSLCHRR
jgi:hypothetical protein